MILYHGTTKENKKKILKEGFKTTYGEYGTCLYLAKSKDLAYEHGDEIIEVFIDDEYIVNVNRYDYNGPLEIEYLALKKHYKAVCVNYNTTLILDFTEVCVYELDIVEING